MKPQSCVAKRCDPGSDGGAATLMHFRTRVRPAGERFSYSSAETQVLGLVLRAATTPSAKQFQPGQASSFFGYGYQTWILPGKQREFMLRGLRGKKPPLP